MSGTALAKGSINAWQKSNATELWHVYGKFSRAKINAYDRCKEICYRMKGANLKIISHNSFVFTAGFEYTDEETGVCMFCYITPNHIYTTEL